MNVSVSQLVKCPQCGHRFELSETFRAHYEQEKQAAVADAVHHMSVKAEAAQEEREAHIRAEAATAARAKLAESAQREESLQVQLRQQQELQEKLAKEQAEREEAIRAEARAQHEQQLADSVQRQESLQAQLRQQQAAQEELQAEKFAKEQAEREEAIRAEAQAQHEQQLADSAQRARIATGTTPATTGGARRAAGEVSPKSRPSERSVRRKFAQRPPRPPKRGSPKPQSSERICKRSCNKRRLNTPSKRR